VVAEPYWSVSPYSTWLVAPSSVVQVMVAPVWVMPLAVTLEITGGVISTSVVKVLSPDSAQRPDPGVPGLDLVVIGGSGGQPGENHRVAGH
jgi:hypothetical protein